MDKTKKIPTILAIILLMAGLVAGVFLVQTQQSYRLSASPSFAPKDLRITNVTDSSFTVSWFTEKNSAGYLEYGDNQSLGIQVFEDDSSAKRVHSINVNGLSADTNYYFKVNSNSESYDNNGVPWLVKTGPVLSQNNNSLILKGKVISEFEGPAASIVIYAQIGGAQLVSTTTSADGNFVLQLGNVRSQDLENFININNRSTLVQVIAQGGPLGTGFAQLYPYQFSLLDTIKLGDSLDYRNQGSQQNIELPNAEIILPEDNQSSGFDF